MINKVILSDLEYICEAKIPWNLLKNKTVLISGANGFLASYLVDTLLYLNEKKNLNVQVIGLVRSTSKALCRFKYAINNAKLKFISQDVCDELKIKEEIDYIIHTASYASPKIFSKDPVGTILPNIVGTNNLLKLAKKNNVECFLFFSTSGVYGYVDEKKYPLKEDDFGILNPTDIESCYLESKRMGENICIAWNHQFQVPVKIVRPAITYGPGVKLDDGRSYTDFISCIVNNKDIEIYSQGTAIRNFCYIADATLGFFTVLLKGKIGEAYNVATDQEISIIDLANYLVKEVFPEKRLKVVKKHKSSQNFLRMNFSRTTVDISKTKELGWELSFPLSEGFKRVVKSFES